MVSAAHMRTKHLQCITFKQININCFQFSPVSFQRKPLDGLQVQSPETSMRKRSAPAEFRTYATFLAVCYKFNVLLLHHILSCFCVHIDCDAKEFKHDVCLTARVWCNKFYL